MGVAEGKCTIEKRIRMKRYILLLVLFGIFFVLPNLAAADCTDLGGFSSFALQGTNTVVLCAGSAPIGKFDIQSCNVTPTSSIRLLNSKVCDGDDVLTDGSRCTVMDVSSSN
jgi:hypothetical protein